jgi:Cd2+/Zn2+-exporting ATPase
MEKEQKNSLKKIIVAVILVFIYKCLEYTIKFPGNNTALFFMYLIPYLIVGYEIIFRALKGILSGELLDENFLMMVASIGAFIIGDHFEGTMVMLLYRVGELFEDTASDKNREHIMDLMDIRPDYANIEKNGEITKVSPDSVDVGNTIVVLAGEKIPIDGIIIDGRAQLNTVALTGEALPISVSPGDRVSSGMINTNSILKIKTTKLFKDSTASKILDLIENSEDKKSTAQNFITKFARVYTPFVCALAILIIVIPYLLNIFIGTTYNLSSYAYKALTFLVISCPCALLLSIPLCFFSTLGCASKKGILIKGSNFVESLANVKYLFFDKTGTLTKGELSVESINVVDKNYTNEDIVFYTACAEIFSSHPIARAVVSEYEKLVNTGNIEKKINKEGIKNYHELSGKGIIVSYEGRKIQIGNSEVLKDNGIDYQINSKVGTYIYLLIDGVLTGYITVCDTLKENSKKAIHDLKKLGIKELIMLTGDNNLVAESVSRQVGIEKFHASLSPAKKVEVVESYDYEKSGKEMIAFVGDGINDAPVLARCDIGIAMGGLGSDSAIEAADVVIMDDDPLKVSVAIRMAKRCMTVVYENIIFVIAVKLLCLILSSLGIVGMGVSVFADVGIMIISVLNAMRLML